MMERRRLVGATVLATVAAFAPRAAPVARGAALGSSSVIGKVEEFTRQQALFDLVYVERIAPATTSAGGLFLVEPEDPPMHLAKVLSVGAGGQGESGLVSGNPGVKEGDFVYCKHPWGIGPKDEQFGEEGEVRRFSFLRYQDIAGVVEK